MGVTSIKYYDFILFTLLGRSVAIYSNNLFLGYKAFYFGFWQNLFFSGCFIVLTPHLSESSHVTVLWAMPLLALCLRLLATCSWKESQFLLLPPNHGYCDLIWQHRIAHHPSPTPQCDAGIWKDSCVTTGRHRSSTRESPRPLIVSLRLWLLPALLDKNKVAPWHRCAVWLHW